MLALSCQVEETQTTESNSTNNNAFCRWHVRREPVTVREPCLERTAYRSYRSQLMVLRRICGNGCCRHMRPQHATTIMQTNRIICKRHNAPAIQTCNSATM